MAARISASSRARDDFSALGLLCIQEGERGSGAHWSAVVALEAVVTVGELVVTHEASNVQAHAASTPCAHDLTPGFRGCGPM